MVKFEPWYSTSLRHCPPLKNIKGGHTTGLQFYVSKEHARHITIWCNGKSIQLPVNNTKEGKKLINLITKMITK